MRKFFYTGKRSANDQTPSYRKPVTLLLPVVLIFTLFVGGALAWLIHTNGPLINTFTPGEITTIIEEKFPGDVKENVKVKNTGNVDAFLRASIIVNWLDADGNVVGPAEIGSYTMTGLPGSNWFEKDGVYYYRLPVAADTSTGNLFDKCVPVNGNAPAGADRLQVIILAQGIQTTQTAVTDAWGTGLIINTDGHLAVG